MMYPSTNCVGSLLHVVSWFFLAAVLFFIGIQQNGLKRRWTACLHLFSSCLCLTAYGLNNHPARRNQDPFPEYVVAFYIGWTVHTMGVLLYNHNSSSQLSSFLLPQRLRAIVLLWIDFRDIQAVQDAAIPQPRILHSRCRISFGLVRLRQALIFLASEHILTQHFARPWLDSLQLTLDDFAPCNQRLLPSLTQRSLALRAIVSTQWIWTTYFHLSAAHNLCAFFFVSVFGWSIQSDWPPLYSSILLAPCLRRFWGKFWHRLHVAPFSRFIHEISSHMRKTNPSEHSSLPRNALYSFLIFFLSAWCHGMVDLIVYHQITFMRQVEFFCLNWLMCLIETMVDRIAAEDWLLVKHANRGKTVDRLRRVAGYMYVFTFFFCAAPRWRYPIVYNK